ncbi:MAG: hypothetical protein MH252_16155 [Thermosynechococcaceae cyanobacterium MS004]|nr:hypothetical protein [Thermosynechococcaceae cyanobacterium MS004]
MTRIDQCTLNLVPLSICVNLILDKIAQPSSCSPARAAQLVQPSAIADGRGLPSEMCPLYLKSSLVQRKVL